MSSPRFSRLHKATALVPLAVLSTAWTASLAGVGATTALATDTTPTTLPDGTSVPTEAIEAPASLSLPGAVSAAVPTGQAGRTVKNASTSGIPSAALAAYQRAETVINGADPACHIDWQLVAAIGRVESDHGRYGGNVLDEDGVATPGIYGIALDGSNNTQRILDTDAGQYDDDAKFDRAVGPMQFIPSTWSVVGVDGDNDGKRNPQDIDDAALASAVYLCSGNDDLSTEPGQRTSVFRYNHSNDYVDLVLSIMQAYMDGEFTAVPNGTTSAGVFTPDPTIPRTQPVRNTGGNQPQQAPQGNGTTSAPAPEPEPAPEEETQAPVPTQAPTEDDEPVVKVPDVESPLPSTGDKTVDDSLTRLEATAKCAAKGVVDNPLTSTNELEACVQDLLG